MKFTQYFLYTHERKDRKDIKMEWIEYVIKNPIKEERQSDGRIRRWAKIANVNNKYLRVVLLEDGETVHNAFFDRSFKEEG
jgi:predicted ATPase